MSLEIFKTEKMIGGFRVCNMDALREEYPEKFNESGSMDWAWFESEIRPNMFIHVRHDKQSISFTLQNGSIKEVGMNGCQIDTIIKAAEMMLQSFQAKFPCDENIQALRYLNDALWWLNERTADRRKRGVEGTNNL